MAAIVVPDLEAYDAMKVGARLEERGLRARAGSAHTSTLEEVHSLVDAETRVLIVALGPVPDSVLESPALELVVKGGIGTENIDLEAARARGVMVTRTLGVNVEGVAEYTIGAMLMISRDLRHVDTAVRHGRWAEAREAAVGRHVELQGKSLGIIGFGGIGRRLAALAEGFGMDVLVNDPPQQAQLAREGVQVASLDDLLATCQFVSVNPVLTEETYHLIDGPALGRMRPDSYLINAARGPIVDTAALAEALREGRIRGAVVDVLEQEPPDPDHPLLSAPNCVLSPHIAGTTADGYVRIGARAVAHVEAFLAGDSLPEGDLVVVP